MEAELRGARAGSSAALPLLVIYCSARPGRRMATALPCVIVAPTCPSEARPNRRPAFKSPCHCSESTPSGSNSKRCSQYPVRATMRQLKAGPTRNPTRSRRAVHRLGSDREAPTTVQPCRTPQPVRPRRASRWCLYQYRRALDDDHQACDPRSTERRRDGDVHGAEALRRRPRTCVLRFSRPSARRSRSRL